jgi:hypothetical protein
MDMYNNRFGQKEIFITLFKHEKLKLTVYEQLLFFDYKQVENEEDFINELNNYELNIEKEQYINKFLEIKNAEIAPSLLQGYIKNAFGVLENDNLELEGV